jgi:hypothetical protein
MEAKLIPRPSSCLAGTSANGVPPSIPPEGAPCPACMDQACAVQRLELEKECLRRRRGQVERMQRNLEDVPGQPNPRPYRLRIGIAKTDCLTRRRELGRANQPISPVDEVHVGPPRLRSLDDVRGTKVDSRLVDPPQETVDQGG